MNPEPPLGREPRTAAVTPAGTGTAATAARSVGAAQLAIAIALTVALLVFQGQRFDDPEYPTADALRYVDYAVNIIEHGVFGLSGTVRAEPAVPGNANTPVYPFWLAAVAMVDADTRATLACLAREAHGTQACDIRLDSLYAAQLALVGLTMLITWWTALRLFASQAPAWAALVALAFSRDLVFYAHRLLTEALVVPLLVLGAFAVAMMARTGHARYALLCGAAFAAAALTRPGAEYLVVFGVACLLVAALVARRIAPARHAVAIALAFAVVVAPWSARNLHALGTAQLTSGYGGFILAQRVAYNDLSAAEVLAASVYWLPDFGDSLARDLFPAQLTARLGSGPGTIYGELAPALYEATLAEVGDPAAVSGTLIREQVLGNPVGQAMSTVPLLVRGVFPGRYFGLLGFVCAVLLCVRAVRRQDWPVLGWALAPVALAVLFASVSVSIPRYNLALLPLYAVGIGWLLTRPWQAAAATIVRS